MYVHIQLSKYKEGVSRFFEQKSSKRVGTKRNLDETGEDFFFINYDFVDI